MAGRTAKLHGVEWRGHPSRQRAQAFLWRTGARRQQPDPAQGRGAEGSQGFRADRQAPETPRHAGQGQWQGRLWYRRDASRHEIRDPCGVSRVRRQGRQGRRQRRRESPGCAEDRHPRRSGCGGWRSHVGGQERPRCARHRLGRRAERPPQFERHLAGFALGKRKRRRGREIRRRYRQGPRHRRQARRILRVAVSRPRNDGATERHGSLQA